MAFNEAYIPGATFRISEVPEKEIYLVQLFPLAEKSS